MRRLPLILILLLSIVACKKIPGNVIKPDKMAALLADLHEAGAVAEAGSSQWRADSSRQALREAVYMAHHVSEADVDTSLMWYGHNLKDYISVYDKTLEVLDKRIAEAEKIGGKPVENRGPLLLDGDSVDIWQGPEALRISALNPSEFITFSYNSDRHWERGDYYTLSLTPVATHAPVYMTIVAAYSDGTAEYVVQEQVSDTRQSLTIVLDSTKIANRLYGSIRYVPDRNEISFIDSITLVRTRTRDNNVAAREGQHTVKLR